MGSTYRINGLAPAVQVPPLPEMGLDLKFSPNFSWIWGVRVGAQKDPVGLCSGSFLQAET